MGQNLSLVCGARNIRGVRTDNGIVVQANHLYLTPEKIAAHETFHELCALYPQLYAQAMAAIEERYPDQASRQAVITRYTEELTGIYGNDEIAIMEEILADAYAGINAFGVNATDFSDTVRGVTENVLGEGRSVAADTVTRGPPQEIAATDAPASAVEASSVEARPTREYSSEELFAMIDQQAAKDSERQAYLEKIGYYDDAQKNTAKDGGERYSIERDIDGNVFVDVTEDILNPNSGESVARTIQRVLSERFGNVIVANGQRIQVNQKTSREFRNSESARGVAKQSVQMYNDKLRTLANADEIVAAARNWIGEELKHTRTDDIVEFARGQVTYRVGQNGYVADVIVGTRKNGEAVLYDIKNIYTTKIVESSGYHGRQSAPNAAQMTSTTGTISQPAADVNPEKYSADDKGTPQYHSPYGIYMPGTPGVGDPNLANKKITAEMSDTERAEILSNKTIVAPHYNGEADAVIAKNAEDLYSREMGLVKKAVQQIYRQFQISSILFNPDMDVVVEVSNGTMKESAKKQVTDPAQLAKVLPLLEQAVEGAVGIECHDNRYYGDYQTKDFAVLLGGYIDGNRFVPVRFGIKRGKDGHNTLYVVVSADAIDVSEVVSNEKEVDTSDTWSTIRTMAGGYRRSTSNVSVTHTIQNVNVENIDLLKYLPETMLNEQQRAGRRNGIEETEKYTREKNNSKYAKAATNARTHTDARRMLSAYAADRGFSPVYDSDRKVIGYVNADGVTKSADITYDNDGNLIPFSDRFDAQNPDERYSVDEPFDFLDEENGGELSP